MARRSGTTLLELLVVCAMTGALLAIAVPPIAAAFDRAAVHAAAADVETQFALARDQALARRAPVWVVLDSAGRAIRVEIPGGGTHERVLGSLYGVAIRSTRDSMSYDARGLGRGAANLTLVLARGRARDTLVVSRLGRVRR
jgi:type II secretory pathway pseudopilin PulG